jgi:hydrogenase-4 component E
MNYETLTLILAGGVLFTGLALISRMRLLSLVNLFRLQSVFVAAIALLVGIAADQPELIGVAVLIIIVKAGVIPTYLTRIRRSVHATERLQSFMRPTPTTLAGVLAIAGAAYVAYGIAPVGNEYLFATVALSLVFFGIVLLLTRTDMYGQTIGFLVMENGLYTFGLMLAHGIPLFVEIGVLFDVLIVFVLFFALIRRAHVEHASTATENLRDLTG